MSLKEYRRKRHFDKTVEPKGRRSGEAARHRFVIQKHAASRLHYDFRLELEGTLKSWAVPKGMPYAKGQKRLAVQVENHPVSYRDFEGVIPKGQYGGGTVMVWDRGTFEPLSKSPAKDLAAGKLHFVLAGKKLQGEWYLVRLRDAKQWLLIRGKSDMRPVSRKMDDTSALSGKSMKELAAGTRVWRSSREEVKAPKSLIENAPGEGTGPTRGRALPISCRPRALTRRPPLRFQTGSKVRAVKKQRQPPLSLRFIEPMKSKLVERLPEGEWIYEIKLDGIRAIALKQGSRVRLISRNEKDLGSDFPEVMDGIESLSAKEAIIDGEIVALDPKGRSSFQLLQARDTGGPRPAIFYYAFDLLQLEGKDLRNDPLTARKARLEKILKHAPDVIRYSASLEGDAAELLKHAGRLGLEGLIGKRKDSEYEPGRRSGAWVKSKLLHEQEMVIGGYSDPEGSRKHFGALLVGCQAKNGLQFAGKVGTGFNEISLDRLHERFVKLAVRRCPFQNLPEKKAGRYGQGITPSKMKACHWVKPALVCQVKFAEWTRDGKLRQPVFLGLREDKDPKEVVRETPE
jgi:bifunctional non-homologous end joining protein LigD